MIKHLPLPPIYLAFLSLLLYLGLFYQNLPVLLLLVLALFSLFYHYSWKTVGQVLFILAGLGLFLTFSWTRAEQRGQTAPDTVEQVQVLPDTLSINGDRLSFRAKADGRLYQAFYQLKSPEEKDYFTQLSQSKILEIDGMLSLAEGRRNFSGFDYRTYLKTQGIYRLLTIKRIKTIRPATNLSILDYLSQWRRRVIVWVKEKFPAPMSHYMTGLLFGYLDKDFAEMSDIYTDLGIIHLFALSGMQVGFFLGYFRKICLRLGLRQDWVDGLQVPFSFVYAGLTGFSVSVIRSLIQALLGRWGVKKLDNFSLTFLICLLLMPNFLLTVGGVLTFGYAFIISMMDFSHLTSHIRKLAECLTLTLGILPLLLVYFSVFQPWSLLLTVLLSFAFDSLILPLLSLVFLLSPVVALTGINPLFSALEMVIKGAGQLVSRPLIFGSPSAGLLCLLLLVLAGLYDFYQLKKVFVCLSLCLALLFVSLKHPLTNEVTMLDVGQGDSILLRDMWGKTVLVDVGGRLEVSGQESWRQGVTTSNASRTLLPYLKSRGIGRIHQLVISHAHADHMGDLEALVQEIKVDEILVSQGSSDQA